MPVTSCWTRRRAGTGGRSNRVAGQRHHRCRKVGIGLDHDDLAMAGLDRDGVGATIGQHQIDLVLANRTEVAEQHIFALRCVGIMDRSEEHTSELQSLMRISYVVFCLKQKQINYVITLTSPSS